MKNNNTTQLVLNFAHRPSLGRDDFMVAPSNQEAVRIIDNWPQWPYFAICIIGAQGCGKTHLANVWAQKIATTNNLAYRIPFIQASQLSDHISQTLYQQSRYIVIENLPDLKNEETLFHLYNTYRDMGGNILFTSNTAPARLKFKLADLQSRMNIVPVYEIKNPDDNLLMALLLKLFSDRQITPSEELLQYLLNNMQRSFAYARKLVEEIDNISLERQHAPSIPMAKEAIAYLNNDLQFNLFS